MPCAGRAILLSMSSATVRLEGCILALPPAGFQVWNRVPILHLMLEQPQQQESSAVTVLGPSVSNQKEPHAEHGNLAAGEGPQSCSQTCLPLLQAAPAAANMGRVSPALKQYSPDTHGCIAGARWHLRDLACSVALLPLK